LTFYVCEIITLGLYIYYFVSNKNDISSGRVNTIPDVILHTALHSILFYYMFQLKCVQLKLESEDYEKHNYHRKRLNWIFIFISVVTVVTLALEIIEKVLVNIEKTNQKQGLLAEMIATRVF